MDEIQKCERTNNFAHLDELLFYKTQYEKLERNMSDSKRMGSSQLKTDQ